MATRKSSFYRKLTTTRWGGNVVFFRDFGMTPKTKINVILLRFMSGKTRRRFLAADPSDDYHMEIN